MILHVVKALLRCADSDTKEWIGSAVEREYCIWDFQEKSVENGETLEQIVRRVFMTELSIRSDLCPKAMENFFIYSTLLSVKAIQPDELTNFHKENPKAVFYSTAQ